MRFQLERAFRRNQNMFLLIRTLQTEFKLDQEQIEVNLSAFRSTFFGLYTVYS